MKKIYNKFKHSIAKNKFYNVLTPILIVIFLVSGYKLISNKSPVNKAELAYLDHSPAGANGGSVMPASCDSYPAHSTCQCNPNTQPPTTFYTPPDPSSCHTPNGVGKVMAHCQGGEWVIDSCTISSCNPGFDLVTDSAGTRCETSCAGNQYRTYTNTFIREGNCNCWSNQSCALNKKEDESSFALNYSPIEHAFAATCLDRDPDIYGLVASCSDCPNGTIPNANHTACVAPATPSVNVNLGN